MVSISFEQVAKEPNGLIKGFVVIKSSVGVSPSTGGHILLELKTFRRGSVTIHQAFTIPTSVKLIIN